MNIKISSDSLKDASNSLNGDLSEILVSQNFARAVYSYGEGEQRSLSLEAMSPTGIDYLKENQITFEKA